MLHLQANKLFLQLNGLALSLDSPGENAFVSHAHFDHVHDAKKVLASKETIELIRARNGKRVNELELNGVELLEAGHVLGSRQLHAELDGTSFLYTGDFKTRDSLTQKGASPREADILVVEATYGSKEYVFPPREEVEKEIAKWVKQGSGKGIVLLGGYALGKAQELVKLLNEFLGIAPVVSGSVLDVCRVYAQNGVQLDFVDSESPEGQEALKKNFVSVVPPNFVRRDLMHGLEKIYGKKVSGAVASGWALRYRMSGDKAFCLSDHCDYNELMEFVEQCAPKKVFCVHGFDREFAHELRKKGFDAAAAQEVGQTNLSKLVV
jgi:putative mRNA 3-end processing factor